MWTNGRADVCRREARQSSAHGRVGDQQTVVALKWGEAKPGEWSITPGRRLSTRIVGSRPCRETDGRDALWVGRGVSNSGAPSSVWRLGSLGASVPRARSILADTEQTSEERASERCARELARAPASTIAVGRRWWWVWRCPERALGAALASGPDGKRCRVREGASLP
jgi:hypothetical protein